jgi:hypothetical protein
MSAKITGQVWDLDIPRMDAWILFAMADHAQHDGTHVFPSQALIAWKTGYSIRQVRRVQDSLKHRKILIPEGSGYRGVQHYRLDFSQVPLKPPFVTRDTMSSEDKMSSVKKTHVNKLLRTSADKMSTEEHSTTDKMTAVKMSSEDISDTSGDSTTDIFDMSPIKDARAESLDTKATKETKTPLPPLPESRSEEPSKAFPLPEGEGVVSEKPSKRGRPGTRLPENWTPTEADYAWAKKKGYHTLVNLDDMTEEFCRYWWSLAKNNTKLDWSMTWQNRVQDLAKQEKDRRVRFARPPQSDEPKYFSDGSRKSESF